MGSNYSKKLEESTNEIITKSISNVLNEIDSTQEVINTADQVITIQADSITGCTFSAGQTITLKTNLYSFVDSKFTDEAVKKLADEIRSDIKTKVEQLNKEFNISQRNKVDIENITNKYINEDFVNSVSDKIKTSIKNHNTFVQKKDLNVSGPIVCYPGQKFDLSQYISIESTVKQITTSIMNSKEISKFLTQVDEKAESEVTQKNIGVNLTFIMIAGIIMACIYMMAQSGALNKIFNRGTGTSTQRAPAAAAPAVVTSSFSIITTPKRSVQPRSIKGTGISNPLSGSRGSRRPPQSIEMYNRTNRVPSRRDLSGSF